MIRGANGENMPSQARLNQTLKADSQERQSLAFVSDAPGLFTTSGPSPVRRLCLPDIPPQTNFDWPRAAACV